MIFSKIKWSLIALGYQLYAFAVLVVVTIALPFIGTFCLVRESWRNRGVEK